MGHDDLNQAANKERRGALTTGIDFGVSGAQMIEIDQSIAYCCLPGDRVQVFERYRYGSLLPSCVAFKRQEPGIDYCELVVSWDKALAYLRLNAVQSPEIAKIFWISTRAPDYTVCEGSTCGFWSQDERGFYAIAADKAGTEPLLREVRVTAVARPRDSASLESRDGAFHLFPAVIPPADKAFGKPHGAV